MVGDAGAVWVALAVLGLEPLQLLLLALALWLLSVLTQLGL